jgi:O-antigen/teichoic acid export membrane protein
LILYSDRFLIGTLISATAITYYVTPYEVITKLILIPDALSGVLFPVFSASFVFNPEITKKMFKRGAKFIFLIVYPIVFLVLTFAYEILDIWLGFEFAQKSHLILQFLAIGVMMNCISLIPTNFFQGIGKPKIITLIVLMELPFYLSAMWYAISSAGIDGAALVFMVAATVNVSILYFIAYRYYGIKLVGKLKGIIIVSFFAVLILPFIVVSLSLKLLLAITFCAIFFIVTWKIILTDEEKLFIVSKLKLRIN